MLDVEINKNDIKNKFIKLDNKIFEEINLNISEINSVEELIEEINKLELKENNLYKLILIGNKKFEINKNKIIKLILNKNIIKIKDNSKFDIDIYKISSENNLKGLFIKELINKMESEEISEEEMQKAIEIGLEVL